MIVIVILAMVAIGGMLFWAYDTDNLNAELFQKGAGMVASFIPDYAENVVGDSILFQIPVVEEHETIPVDYDIANVTDAQFYENGTAISNESYITGLIADTSYSSSGVKQSEYQIVGDRMFVQLGNIAVIEGQIKILDPLTKEMIEPRIYKYNIEILCSELTEFCNTAPRAFRGETNTGGGFIERWTTNITMQEGLYEVIIDAESAHLKADGTPYRVSNTLFIVLYK